VNRCISLVAFLVLGPASVICGGDWPAWRGPQGDGLAPESDVPISWSATDHIAWKTAVPGTGRSSPIVCRDRVFVTAGDAADQSRRVVCVDAETGDVVWNVSVHHGEAGEMHKFNTTASSTPATDGERVYCVFVDDHDLYVFALDYDGNVVWSKRPGAFFSSHGMAASPVLYQDGVVINGQQDGDAFVVMLNRVTGDEIWRYKPVNLRSFSTPVIISHEGQDQMILTGATETVALNPATGERIWYAEGPSEKFVSTPSVGHGMVFSFGGSDEKKAMAIRLGGHDNVLDSHVVWRAERAMPYVPSPLLVGDYLHVVNDAGIYTCLNPLTGKPHSTGRKLGSVYSSPVAVGERIYFFEDSGACTVIQNGPRFEVLARNELGEEVYTTPAISHDSLFIRTVSRLIRIGVSKSVQAADGSGRLVTPVSATD
jgi:outer membrane protein assembly factor BamB